MRTRYCCVHRKNAGLTLIEVLVIVATLVIAAAVLIPAFGPERPRSRAMCINNLKQIGVAFIDWSHDREAGFPWTVPERQGGTLEYATSSEAFRHFQIASNELVTPKVLICPQDSGRKAASTFDEFSNRNLSYFIGVDSDPSKSNSLLSGDRTITTNHVVLSGTVDFRYPKSVYWANGIHQDAGHVVWADGSVQEVDQLELRQTLQDRGSLPARLNIP